MASSKDFGKIWESYQEVVKTKDISIADYCQCLSAFGRFVLCLANRCNEELTAWVDLLQKMVKNLKKQLELS